MGARLALPGRYPRRRDEVGDRQPAGGLFHELRPYGQGRPRPGEPQLRLAVEAHPHQGQEVRRVPREPGVPGVVGGARLACRGAREPPQARAPRGAPVDDPPQHVVHVEGDFGRDDALHPDVPLLQDGPVAVHHVLDGQEVGAYAVVGQGGEGPRHFEGRHFHRAQGQGGQQRKAALDTHSIGHLAHLPDAHVLRDARGGGVQGPFHGLAHGDLAEIAVVVVLRRPHLAAEAPGERRVFHVGGAVVGLAGLGRAVGQGGQIDEGLEHGAGLPPGLDRAVELGLAVVPSADHGLDLARLRLDDHQRALQVVGLRPPPQMPVVLLQPGEAPGQGPRRGLLQLQVQAREDAQPFRGQRLFGVVLGQLLLHVVGEVGGLVPGPHRFPLLEDFLQRAFVGGARDHAVPHQLGQHHVAPSDGPLHVAVGGVAVRRADQPGQQGGFAHRQLLGLLREVEPRAFPDAEDPLGPVLAQVDLVEVVLEDLFLGVHPLGDHGHERFLDLALEGAVALQEEVLHELLGQGAAALHHPSPPQVGHEGPHHRHRVHAAMVVEALVLHREHGLLHHGRHVFQPDDPPLFPDAVVETGDHLGLQLQGRKEFAAVEPLYAPDGPRLEGDAHGKAPEVPQGVTEVVQEDLEHRGLGADAVLPFRRRPVPGGSIAQPAQLLPQPVRGDLHPRVEDLAVGIDLRGELPLAPLEPGLHHAAGLPGVPARPSRARQDRQQAQGCGDLEQPQEEAFERGSHGSVPARPG